MSVKRIQLLNAPDGSISTADKYQFLAGINPQEETPIMSTIYKTKFNPFTGRLQWVTNPDAIETVKFKAGVANYAALPLTGNIENDARITNDTGHLYIWNGTTWIDQGDILDLSWDSITGGPSSTPANIDDAVAKKHSNSLDHIQGTDIYYANDIINDSDVTGIKVKDALNTLNSTIINGISSDVSGDYKKITKLRYNSLTGEIQVLYEV